jgi:hypothetical protein
MPALIIGMSLFYQVSANRTVIFHGSLHFSESAGRVPGEIVDGLKPFPHF